jgi:hypothetical protein
MRRAFPSTVMHNKPITHVASCIGIEHLSISGLFSPAIAPATARFTPTAKQPPAVSQAMPKDTVAFSGSANNLSEQQNALAKAIKALVSPTTQLDMPSNPYELHKFFFAQSQLYFNSLVRDQYDLMVDLGEEGGPELIDDSIGDYAQEHISEGFLPALGSKMGRPIHMEDLAELLSMDEDTFVDTLYETFHEAIAELKAEVAEEEY